MKRLFLCVLAFAVVGCNRYDRDFSARETHRYHETIDGGAAKDVKAALHMGAGRLTVESGGPKLLEADIRTAGDMPKMRYDTGEHGRLLVEQTSESLRGRNGDNEWDLKLGGPAAMDLEVHLGAGEADIDLSGLKLRNVEVHMGAGRLKLDLRGAYTSNVNVEVHGGVGEAVIKLPKKMRIEAEASGGLGEIEAHGLDHDGDRYVSRKGSADGPKMDMQVHGGIGRIELDAE